MTITLITNIAQKAPEEGTFPVTVAYFDENQAAVTPTAATWTLTDDRGSVINEREDEAITPLATTNIILLTGDDLTIGANGINRRLLVEFTYNSSLGTGLLGKAQLNFQLENFQAVT